MYLISLGAGILAGLLYGLINVRSPAPPAIALIGLLGILIGEQIVPVAKRVIGGEPLTVSWFASECRPKITGVQAKAPQEGAAADCEPGSRQG
jgi:XapX domain-containing protein